MSDIRDAFRSQAKACAELGSPFMERLMGLAATRLAPGTAVADHLLHWPGDPAVNVDNGPLRLAGALHALKLQGLALVDEYPPHKVSDDALWDAVFQAMQDHTAWILEWLASPPQTNEVRRSAALLPALALIEERHSLPVELLELGTSGGLNLRADLFHLELPSGCIGPEDSKVKLTPEWRGTKPAALRLPHVVRRAGADLSPLDPANDDDQLRLLAYLWADQPDRMQRTKAAIETAIACPVETTAEDAGDWLARQLARPSDGRLCVVFHTLAWQYFPEATRKTAEVAMETHEGPLVRIAMEADGGSGAILTLTTYPDGTVETLGRADFHGRWIDWHAG